MAFQITEICSITRSAKSGDRQAVAASI